MYITFKKYSPGSVPLLGLTPKLKYKQISIMAKYEQISMMLLTPPTDVLMFISNSSSYAALLLNFAI